MLWVLLLAIRIAIYAGDPYADDEYLYGYDDDSLAQIFGMIFAFFFAAIGPLLMLCWRRTRRLGTYLLGANVISAITFCNYMALIICSIGYLLALILIWPNWRLLYWVKTTPSAQDKVPSQGVLQSRPWPHSRGDSQKGVTLISVVVGVTCLLAVAAVSIQLVSQTMSAIGRADRSAAAMELLEGIRERQLTGLDTQKVQTRAAASLRDGRVSVRRNDRADGLVLHTAVATWTDPDGRSGQAILEWLQPKEVK